MKKLIGWIFGFNKEIKHLKEFSNSKDNEILKLKQDLKDIIEAEEKKEVKIIYETGELNQKTIRVHKHFYSNEISEENEIEVLNELTISLLPYINYSKYNTTSAENIIENDVFNYDYQLTILTD